MGEQVQAMALPSWEIVGEVAFGLTESSRGARWTLSEDGAVLVNYGDRFLGWRTNPAMTAFHVLRSMRAVPDDSSSIHRVVAGIEWLLANAQDRGNGLAWYYDFDYPEGLTTLHAPWPSAMSQGLAVSALVRTARLPEAIRLLGVEPETLLDTAQAALRLFDVPVSQGGVLSSLRGRATYEEYPAPLPPRILDGFAFALLGLRDADRAGLDDANRLYGAGLAALEECIDYWDWMGVWSRYGSHGLLCTDGYHRLNIALLLALSGDAPGLRDVATRWTESSSRPLVRASVAVARWCMVRRLRVRRRFSRTRRERQAVMSKPREQ